MLNILYVMIIICYNHNNTISISLVSFYNMVDNIYIYISLYHIDAEWLMVNG